MQERQEQKAQSGPKKKTFLSSILHSIWPDIKLQKYFFYPFVAHSLKARSIFFLLLLLVLVLVLLTGFVFNCFVLSLAFLREHREWEFILASSWFLLYFLYILYFIFLLRIWTPRQTFWRRFFFIILLFFWCCFSVFLFFYPTLLNLRTSRQCGDCWW